MTPEQKRRKLILMQEQARAKAQATPAPPQVDRHGAPVISQDALRERFDREANRAEFLQAQVEGATLGLIGDEARAGLSALTGPESYSEALSRERAEESQFREASPGASILADVSGVVVPGVAAAKTVQQVTGAGRTGAAAITGAGGGATYSAAEGEGVKDRAADAFVGGMAGALFGATASKTLDTLTTVPQRVKTLFNRSEQRPSTGLLKATKNAAYRAVDDSGETFSSDDLTGLYLQVSDLFEAKNYVEEVDDASRAVLRTIERRAEKPTTTLSQLDGVRQSLWKRYSRASDQPQILDAIWSIDELIATRADASELMSVARAANSRFAKAQLLENAFTKAERQTASTGSGGNILNKYRQAVTSILSDDKKNRFFTQEEIDLMDRFVRGDFKENMLRKLGKLSPDGNGLMLTLHVVGGMASSGATLPAAAVGSVAKRRADRAVEKGAENLLDVVSGFRPANPPQIPFTPAAGAISAASVPFAQDAADTTTRAARQLLRNRSR